MIIPLIAILTIFIIFQRYKDDNYKKELEKRQRDYYKRNYPDKEKTYKKNKQKIKEDLISTPVKRNYPHKEEKYIKTNTQIIKEDLISTLVKYEEKFPEQQRSISSFVRFKADGFLDFEKWTKYDAGKINLHPIEQLMAYRLAKIDALKYPRYIKEDLILATNSSRTEEEFLDSYPRLAKHFSFQYDKPRKWEENKNIDTQNQKNEEIKANKRLLIAKKHGLEENSQE